MSSWHDKNAKAWQNSFKYFQSEFHGFTNESNIYKIYLRKHTIQYQQSNYVPLYYILSLLWHLALIG